MEMLTLVGTLPSDGVAVGPGVGVTTTVGVGWDGASLPQELTRSAGSRSEVSL
jgi:hypothetical protein